MQMIIKARMAFAKERCSTILQEQEHGAQQCLRVASVISQWPQVQTCRSSAHMPKRKERPVSLRLREV